METTFVADYDYECPYCMGQMDYVGEDKKCRECGKVFKVYTLEGEENEKY